MAVTLQTNIIVPSVFQKRIQQMTAIKSGLVRSGAVVADSELDGFCQPSNGGLLFNIKTMQDLDDTAANIPTDTAYADDGTGNATPKNLTESQEIGVKLHRNQVWGWNQLARNISGQDLLSSVENKVAAYVLRKEDDDFIATMTGIFADNAAAPAGSEHVQGDLTFDNSNGGVYVAGVSDVSGEAIIDALATLGDNSEDISLMMMHSTVAHRLRKLDLIDFVRDSDNMAIGGRMAKYGDIDVIVNDKMPNASDVYDTWFFGRGAVLRGAAGDDIPVEVDRKPEGGNGAGETRLHYRWIRMFHAAGHKYVGTAPAGGPSTAATTNNLGAAASWMRVFPERKQIKICRLLTTEA